MRLFEQLILNDLIMLYLNESDKRIRDLEYLSKDKEAYIQILYKEIRYHRETSDEYRNIIYTQYDKIRSYKKQIRELSS